MEEGEESGKYPVREMGVWYGAQSEFREGRGS